MPSRGDASKEPSILPWSLSDHPRDISLAANLFCLAELPNLRKLYDTYHDKDFEVVSISLDERRPALEVFLEKEPLPWIVLHDQGWDKNKNSQHYGVTSVPTRLLVDRTGKIISTDARGEELAKQIAAICCEQRVQIKETKTTN